MRAISATVTPTSRLAMINIDHYATAVLGVQIVCTGGANYWLQHSFDDPNDLVNPVPVANMFWDNSLLPPGVDVNNASVSFNIMAAPLWFQLRLTNTNGLVRATFAQIGEHSHSNITKGPFAPPHMAAALGGEGTNFGAMPK